MGLMMMSDGKFVSRDEVALVPTPCGTESWKPVPHMEVIDAVTEVVKAHNWQILDENFGLAREGQKMFGVMRINKTNSTDWSRCIGLRNSHDKSFAVGLSAGINVTVCSNLAFGGTTVIKRLWSWTSHNVKGGFIRTFREGYSTPKMRTSLADWKNYLYEMIVQMNKYAERTDIFPEKPNLNAAGGKRFHAGKRVYKNLQTSI